METKDCPKCGCKVGVKSEGCPVCGYSFLTGTVEQPIPDISDTHTTSQTSTYPDKPEKNGSRWFWIVVASIAFLCVVGMFVFMLTDIGNHKKAIETAELQQTDSVQSQVIPIAQEAPINQTLDYNDYSNEERVTETVLAYNGDFSKNGKSWPISLELKKDSKGNIVYAKYKNEGYGTVLDMEVVKSGPTLLMLKSKSTPILSLHLSSSNGYKDFTGYATQGNERLDVKLHNSMSSTHSYVAPASSPSLRDSVSNEPSISTSYQYDKFGKSSGDYHWEGKAFAANPETAKFNEIAINYCYSGGTANNWNCTLMDMGAKVGEAIALTVTGEYDRGIVLTGNNITIRMRYPQNDISGGEIIYKGQKYSMNLPILDAYCD